MRIMGLEAIYKRPKTSQPHPAHTIFQVFHHVMRSHAPGGLVVDVGSLQALIDNGGIFH